MKISSRWYVMFSLLMLTSTLLAGCNGGDSSGPTQTAPASSSVSGVASRGLLNGATVTAYSLDASGVKGLVRGSATTDSKGSYSINLGTYTGGVIIEASGGTYTDDATGQNKTNTVLLRAAVTNVSGNVSAAVTPLTEIALQRAGTLTTANIDSANALVSNMIGGINIISTQPANVVVSSASTTAEKNYGLALAALSQMVSSGTATSLSGAISQIATDLSDNKIDSTGGNISTALNTFIASSNNQTGLTTSSATVVTAVASATSNPLPAVSLAGNYVNISQQVGFSTYQTGTFVNSQSLVFGSTGTVKIADNGDCTTTYTGYAYHLRYADNVVSTTPQIRNNVTCPAGKKYASVDGQVLLSTSTDTSSNRQLLLQGISLKQGSGMSSASLNGTYASVLQQVGILTNGTSTATFFRGMSDTVMFNGAGTVTDSGTEYEYMMFKATNTIQLTPNVVTNATNTYSVASDGAITIPGWLTSGWASPDGNVILLGRVHEDAGEKEVGQEVLVKKGSGMTNASLKGTFAINMQSAGFYLATGGSGTVAGSMVHKYQELWTFDGSGGCTLLSSGDDFEFTTTGGPVTILPNAGGTATCTYSVAGDGTITMVVGGFNLPLWLSANGNVFIWGGGGWSNSSISGGAIPVKDGGPVWSEQGIGIKVQN